MKKRFKGFAALGVLVCAGAALAGCSGFTEYGVTITNKDALQEKWSVGDAARSLSLDLEPTGNPSSEIATGNLIVESSDPSVITATGLSLTAQGIGSATITVYYYDATDSVDLSVVEATYDTIGDINAGLKAGKIKDGDTVRFYGRVIASMEQSSTHLYSGVYLGDGEDTLMLYSGQISNLWFDGSEPVYHLGDDILVTATVSAYSGFYEFNPTLIEQLPEEYTVKETPILTPTEAEWNAFDCYDVGQPVTLTLTYKSTSALPASGDHGTLYFTYGSTDVLVYCNYHNGSAVQEALATKVADLVAGDKVTITGVVAWHDGIQLGPQFMLIDGVEVSPVDCFVTPEKTAPTSITISAASTTIEAYGTTQLTLAVTPSNASQSVTWTSSNKSVAVVSSSGLVTGLSAGTATITATSTADANVVSNQLTITITTSTKYSLTSVKTNVKLGLYQENKGNYYYFTGTKDGNFGAMSTSWDDGVEFTIYTNTLDTEGTTYYYLGFTYEGVPYFFGHTDASNSQVALNYVPYPVQYDSAHNAILNTDATRFLGTYLSYETLSWSETSYLGNSGQFIATFYESAQAVETYEFTRATSLTSGSEYYLGCPQESGSSSYYFWDGGNYSGQQLTATGNINNAVKVKATGNDTEGWTLTGTVNGVEHTIYTYYTGQYYDVSSVASTSLESTLNEHTDGATAKWFWDSTYNGIYVTLNTYKYFLAQNSNSTYAYEFPISSYSYNASSYTWIGFYQIAS